MALASMRHVKTLLSTGGACQHSKHFQRNIILTQRYRGPTASDSEERTELAVQKAREIFEKEFPDHFKNGKFISRMSYVEFIDESLSRLKEFGLERDINAYKELLRIFPPGKFWPKKWDGTFGLFHAPQQLAAVRVLHQMQMSGLRPDKEIEKLIVDAFSKRSDVWVKVIRMNYWSMKGRNVDPNPLPEKLPTEPHKLAKLAIARMLDDPKSIITVTNSSRVPTCVDKTWIVFSQSPTQKEIIDKLPESSTLYVEEGGLSYVDRNYLSYYLLKYYVDEETLERKSQKPKPDFNFNTLKVKFYGKPIEEKYAEFQDKHYVDGSYVLGICTTGTSSQDSLLSWLKILEERNPKLSKMNVVFKSSRRSPEIIEYQDNSQQSSEHKQNSNGGGGRQEQDSSVRQSFTSK